MAERWAIIGCDDEGVTVEKVDTDPEALADAVSSWAQQEVDKWPQLGLVYMLIGPEELALLPPEDIPRSRVTITLPGVADGVVRDGGWRQDHPAWWKIYQQGERVRAGFGSRYVVTLPAEAAASLREYLASVEGALASMTTEEMGSSGMSELRALRAALSKWPEGRGE